MNKLKEVYDYLEIDNYRDWYSLGFVNYGALYTRLACYYQIAFDDVI
jgi:hypothetical protein